MALPWNVCGPLGGDVSGGMEVGKAPLFHPNHCRDRSGESRLVLQTRPTVFDFLRLKQNGWRKTKLWTVPIGRRTLWILDLDASRLDFCSGTFVILLFWLLWSRSGHAELWCGFSCLLLVEIAGVHQVARVFGYSTRPSLCLWFFSLFLDWRCYLLLSCCTGA